MVSEVKLFTPECKEEIVAKSAFTLPARGTFPTVELAKKAPKKVDALLITTFTGEDGLEVPGSALLSPDALRATYDALAAVGATGRAGEITRIPAPKDAAASTIVAVGLGDAELLDAEILRRNAGAAARALAGAGAVATTLSDFGISAAVEGLILGGYSYRGIRSTEASEAEAPASFTVIGGKSAAEEFEAARITAEAVNLARDLVNTPANVLYPETYAEFITAEAEAAGLEVEVLDEKQLEKKGFGGIISVGKGSQRPPRLVRLTWAPKKAKTSVALVGKGITFDTGGISLKPGNGMWDMISDMGGSAAMAAAIIAAAKLEIPVKITATLPFAENMPGSGATRPGDVITHYGGITSEVLNTDAEGRLVLADAIARASEDNPDYLIETATLTGAQIVALGTRTAGVMGSEIFRDRIAEIGREVGENAWAMPLLEEHDEEIKSQAADIRNINAKREGGMEYAGTYLQKFVGEGIEWAHIDVAGPSWNNGGPRGYTPKRATGVPVRTVVATLREIASK
ncbi:leucyl aminopeptidase [Corynebacterium striatum]|uniref:leucyl aminopeptidase n=1 Tax=Corynebacterium striatum TaxID=43770 RepID=UPI00234DF006|nr:leucyl aminopeptidase [Corynebacterium striatum]MDC7105218.1 leucyl aminopeptidase [Corynebacterium striatum]HCD3016924.1 leucyl aminopeptidase [Corynebacterium striatum]